MPLKIQHDETPALNLTSMIDVLFLLIIFFMVATKFDELDRNLHVAVPQVSEADDSTPLSQPMVVTVLKDGGIQLDDAAVTLEELTARLTDTRQSNAALSVIIRGDAKCDFQSVAAALAACRQAGVAELGITVRVASLGTTTAR